MTRTINFHDPIDNGVLFSEVCANLLRENKGLIKEIVTTDQYGNASKSGLVLAATETNVKSLAQVLHNYRMCLSACTEIPLLHDISNYIAEDFIFGDVSLPKLLFQKFQVQEIERQKQDRRSVSVGRGSHLENIERAKARRSRSHSPSNSHFMDGQNAGKVIKRATKSCSTPPAGLKFRQLNEISHVGKINSVKFANTAPPQRELKSNRSGDEMNRRSRSVSPSAKKELAGRSAAESKHRSLSAGRKQRVSFSLPTPRERCDKSSDKPYHRTATAHSFQGQVRGRSASPMKHQLMTSPDQSHRRATPKSNFNSSSSGGGGDNSSTETSPRSDAESDNSQTMSSSQLLESVLAAADQLAPTPAERGRRSLSRHKSPSVRPRKPAPEPILADVGPTPYDTEVLSPQGMVDPRAYQLHRAPRGLSKVDRSRRSYTDYLPHRSPSYDPTARRGWWSPPQLTQMEKIAASQDTFPMITSAQQVAVRQWVISLGLVIRDGEGGFVSRIDGPSNTPDTSLFDDRLRNGEMLCDLFMLLERNASIHAQLSRLVHRKPPMTIKKATENIQRACWLFRLKKCPPIPLKYLTHPEEILKGNRAVLWGLLWEILQASPIYAVDFSKKNAFGGFASLSPETGAGSTGESCSKVQSQATLHDDNYSPGSVAASELTTDVFAASSNSFPNQPPNRSWVGNNGCRTNDKVPLLPYTPEARRQLDQSLVQWLYDKEVIIQPLMGHLVPIPVTVLALEGPIRDGTLLCKLTECVLSPDDAAPTKTKGRNTFRYVGANGGTGWNVCRGWNKSPQSYTQCIANVKKCLDCLRMVNNSAGSIATGTGTGTGTDGVHLFKSGACAYMSSRYLHGQMEEDVVRGDWNAILGLLEDMHCFDDRQPPRSEFPGAGAQIEHPYLGSTYQKYVDIQKRASNPGGDQLFDFFAPQAQTATAEGAGSQPVGGSVRLTGEREKAHRPMGTETDEGLLSGTGGSAGDLFPKPAPRSDKPGAIAAVDEGGDGEAVRLAPLVVSDPASVPFFKELPQTLASRLNQHKSEDPDLVPDLNYVGGSHDGNGLLGHPPEIIPQQVHQVQMLHRRGRGQEQGETNLAERDYERQDFTGSSSIANANSSPLKLKVQVLTGRKMHSQHTPAEHAAYNYSFVDTAPGGTVAAGAGNWFFGTPQKDVHRAPLNDVYDDSESVHSSGGVGHTPTSIETPESKEIRKQDKIAATKKLNFVGMEYEDSSSSDNKTHRTKKFPLNRLQSLVPQGPVSTNSAVRVGKVPTKAPSIIKKSSSKSPIQSLIFQKQYRDAATAAQWLESKFKLTFIPPFNAPVVSDADAENKDELVATLYGRHIYDSLSRLHDGVVLCKLCQQMYRIELIPGTTYAPKTRAHKLQNIRKALGIILSKNKRIPASQILAKEDDIIEGNCTVILELLLMLKRIL